MKYDFRTDAQKRTEERRAKVVADFKKVYPKAPNASRAATLVAEMNGITRQGVVTILKLVGIYKTNGGGMAPTVVL